MLPLSIASLDFYAILSFLKHAKSDDFMSSCCHTDQNNEHNKHKNPLIKLWHSFDWILYGSAFVILAAIILPMIIPSLTTLDHFSHALTGFLSKMWWGVLLGLTAVGFMHFIPREYFQTMLGKGDSFGGIIRAALAGLLLDMCSHGILVVGAKLYERGISNAQIMTFLIASPWNSLSLTFILISLIGIGWTLAFILASALIAIITGILYLYLTKKEFLPTNPHTIEIADGFDIKADFKERIKHFKINKTNLSLFFQSSIGESRMILRWLLFGTIIASLIQTFVDTHTLQAYFGPTMLGLFLTLIATTIIEVCSEGSAPIGAELINRAGAPGNGFTFLMAGVATDYTEIMVLREFTKSWKITMMLPILTIPQILVLGYIMNVIGAG